MATNIHSSISLRLAMIGVRVTGGDEAELALIEPLIARQRELGRQLANHLSPVDTRIQQFIDSYLADASVHPKLPGQTLVLDQPGLARELSLPIDGDEFHAENVESYRLRNGVLHNPKNDRRTTAGVFHVTEGGLPIPDDKIVVTKDVYARLLDLAFQPPAEDMVLPYVSNQEEPEGCFVSLYMRPLVVPAVPGATRRMSMETRFFAPGGMVCNLDFVEGIFGNAGDPDLPDNNAALDPAAWSGHTGCVILAPHLTKVTKKSLGMPHWDEATERQRRDGQCWKEESDLYNDGKAFKVCIRDERGVFVTILADNYFGYCKKEVKTQLSYATNLLGNAEEEHSGGARVYPAYNLGQEYRDKYTPDEYSIQEIVKRDPKRFTMQVGGWAKDNEHEDFILIPPHATFSMRDQSITWKDVTGREERLKLKAGQDYFLPNGYRVYVKSRDSDATQWQLFGVSPISTDFHKPATVSGGGKSEVSKSLLDAFVSGSAYVTDTEKDLGAVQELLDRDYTNRFANDEENGKDHRPILSDERSLGSVIKLMTPSSDFNDEYNAFLNSIPSHIKELLFTVKRYYKPEWKDAWREHFTASVINGRPGNSLLLDGEKVIANMLRVGFDHDGSWRLFSLRPDFSPAVKVQTEDDITASTVAGVYETAAPGFGNPNGLPRKFVENCEHLLFQRPDDAVVRGYDKQAEHDLAQPGTFISNFEPLTYDDAKEIYENPQQFSEYTKPIQRLIKQVVKAGPDASPQFWTCSDRSRIVNGARSKNPRYLQTRPDDANPRATAAAELASRLVRQRSVDGIAPMPVDVVAAGRRNNPAEPGIPPLCVYNPLHYMELPELFMEFIASMTGKSPSTTGAGSEGALTKAPFNAMPYVIDLNNSLLSYILTGYDGWLSSAGYIGPQVKVAHDISMLVPELFSRMRPEERDAHTLIEGGFLEPLQNYEYDGKPVYASRLGYRMTMKFATKFFGRIFLHPNVVFTEEMLRPELQDEATFATSMDVIVKTHKRVAQQYFADDTIKLACPPLKGLLEIMANGETAEGWKLSSPEFRSLFERKNVLATDWYRARLDAKQSYEISRLSDGVDRMRDFLSNASNERAATRINLQAKLDLAEHDLTHAQSGDYRNSLIGTIGRQVHLS